MNDQVTLAAYADQVRELIHHERHDEAIAICRHILEYYPLYVEAYRQLGEAYLETGDSENAKDLFFRVLSADPESLVAHVGLAVLFEQEQLPNEAIWHMERAYEFMPGNAELQKELLRLYQANKLPARVTLTPAALARVYARQGLFSQSIQEFRAIIADAPSRFDIRVALAEALWNAGRVRDAADVAFGVLKQLKDCLKANLILGAAWKEAGLPESETYLQHAQALDPLNRAAVEWFGARSPLLPLQPTVPPYLPGAAAPTAHAPQIETLQPAGLIEESETLPSPSAMPTDEELLPIEPTQLTTAETPLPDWLRPSLTEALGAVDQAPATTPSTESTLAPIEQESVSEEPSPAQIEEQTPKEDEPDKSIGVGEEIPSWLGAASQLPVETEESKAETERSASAELPAWMQVAAKSPKPVEPLAAEPLTEKTETSQLPAWLAEPPAKVESAAPSVQPSPASAETVGPVEPMPSPPASGETSSDQLPTQLTVTAMLDEPMPPVEPPSPEPIAPIQQATVEPTPQMVQPLVTEQVAEMPSEILAAPIFPPDQTALATPVEAPVAPAAPSVAPPKPQPKGLTHLWQAREHRDAQRWRAALDEYDYVVQRAPRLVNEVIADLEALTQRIDAPLEAHRILGDAYTRADRLAEALERYRFALEHVS